MASFNVPSEDTVCGTRSPVVRFIKISRNPNPVVFPESCSQSQTTLWHPRTHLSRT